MKRIVSLNGRWDFVVDLDPKYHLDTRIYSAPAHADPQESRRHWLAVRVPSVWQRYGERYDIFEGVGW